MASLCEYEKPELEAALAAAGLVRSHAAALLREFYRGAGAIDSRG